MKIAIAQVNSVVGDLSGNVALILDYVRRAEAAGAGLVVAPELSLCGYPPEDLLLRPEFIEASARALASLARGVGETALVVGHPHLLRGRLYNAASLLRGGRVEATYLKHKLPNYDVFDEARYFSAGTQGCVFEHGGLVFGINICADVWEEGAPAVARHAGADVLLVLNASPYHRDKQMSRYEAIRDRVGETGLAIVYANAVGGQDELVFDGASFVMDGAAHLTHQFPSFVEHLGLVEFDGPRPLPGELAPHLDLEASVYRALCLGVRDYLDKNGFPGALVAVSGGIDSALTLAVAVDALGPARVRAVMLPSQYTADISTEDARLLANALGVRYDEMAIRPVFDAFLDTLAEEFAGLAPDTTEENLQARIRGTIMMALSNKYGSIVLTTGNKSEMSVGYATLYGDMAGGFAVLKDVTKTLVWALARYRNTIAPVIPERTIERAPSAELKPDQKDQDSLPPYDVLDGIIEMFVERDLSAAEIVEAGYDRADVERVVKLIKRSEYKRRQSPQGIRITPRGFGKDWRYPITSRF